MPIFYEKGRYRCRVIDQALGKASTGTPQFVLKFLVLARIVGPEATADVMQYERTAYFYITEKTAQRLCEDLRNLGFSGESFAQLDLENPECHDFRGAEVDMYVQDDQNQQGEPRERWSAARVSAGLDVQPLDRKQARDLDNLFGKHLKGAKANGAAKPATQAASAPIAAGIADDDIPF